MRFETRFQELDQRVGVAFGIDAAILPLEFGTVINEKVTPNIYDGDTEVIPDFTRQVLPTGATYVPEDIAVQAIPVHRVSNASGGRTVFIGGILDD